MKVSSKRNHFDVITSKCRRDWTATIVWARFLISSLINELFIYLFSRDTVHTDGHSTVNMRLVVYKCTSL